MTTDPTATGSRSSPPASTEARIFTDKYGGLLLPPGGYRTLKSFQLAQLVSDITVHFVELYIHRESRTRDQMVQATRSGVQNIPVPTCSV